MKILHILNDGSNDLAGRVIDVQSKEGDVKVVDLAKGVSYESLVDDIFAHDKVISW